MRVNVGVVAGSAHPIPVLSFEVGAHGLPRVGELVELADHRWRVVAVLWGEEPSAARARMMAICGSPVLIPKVVLEAAGPAVGVHP